MASGHQNECIFADYHVGLRVLGLRVRNCQKQPLDEHILTSSRQCFFFALK